MVVDLTFTELNWSELYIPFTQSVIISLLLISFQNEWVSFWLLDNYNIHWRGFDPRQQKVVFGAILVPQSNTIMCKHNMI